MYRWRRPGLGGLGDSKQGEGQAENSDDAGQG
jgi:hypothetical protein